MIATPIETKGITKEIMTEITIKTMKGTRKEISIEITIEIMTEIMTEVPLEAVVVATTEEGTDNMVEEAPEVASGAEVDITDSINRKTQLSIETTRRSRMKRAASRSFKEGLKRSHTRATCQHLTQTKEAQDRQLEHREAEAMEIPSMSEE